jgi:hypothetical protein
VTCEQKFTDSDNAALKTWQKSDGMQRSIFGGVFVLLLAGLMIPVPIVHFAAIPVILIGLPSVTFFVYRLYSSGTDLEAGITCPECGTTRQITRSVEVWPVSLQCLGCQKHLSLTRNG